MFMTFIQREPPMALLYKSDPVRGQHWQALFAEHAPDIAWRAWPDLGNPEEIHYLAAWQAPDNVEQLLPNLKVLFALSAGVDQLDLERLPEALPVVRLLDPGITRACVNTPAGRCSACTATCCATASNSMPGIGRRTRCGQRRADAWV